MEHSVINRLLSIEEVMEKLRVSRSTVYRLLGSRRIEALKIGRSVRIPDESVDRLIAEAPRAQITPEIN